MLDLSTADQPLMVRSKLLVRSLHTLPEARRQTPPGSLWARCTLGWGGQYIFTARWAQLLPGTVLLKYMLTRRYGVSDTSRLAAFEAAAGVRLLRGGQWVSEAQMCTNGLEGALGSALWWLSNAGAAAAEQSRGAVQCSAVHAGLRRG
jgi:hypothetical protein